MQAAAARLWALPCLHAAEAGPQAPRQPPPPAAAPPHLLGHHLNTEDAILSQEHVGLEGVQLRLAVQAVEVLPQGLALHGGTAVGQGGVSRLQAARRRAVQACAGAAHHLHPAAAGQAASPTLRVLRRTSTAAQRNAQKAPGSTVRKPQMDSMGFCSRCDTCGGEGKGGGRAARGGDVEAERRGVHHRCSLLPGVCAEVKKPASLGPPHPPSTRRTARR